MARNRLGRRHLLKAAAGAAGMLASAGCDNLSRSELVRQWLGYTESLTERVQRALTPGSAMAKEYEERDISAVFPPNGRHASWNRGLRGQGRARLRRLADCSDGSDRQARDMVGCGPSRDAVAHANYPA
ncbi:MAG: hypothetical protein QM706_14430 [Nitrospira sp.]